VLTGALVVGDSVRGSLLHLALDRLGRIDEILAVPRFFRAQLARDLAEQPEFRRHFAAAVPLAMLEGTVEDPDSHRRATHVNILGIDEAFGRLSADDSAESVPPAPGKVYLNQALADELGVAVGNDCIVRLPVAREVPADSALGRKTETVTNLRLAVARVVPAEGLGRFALRPNQSVPRAAFVNLPDIQKILNVPGKVNAIFVGGEGSTDDDSPSQLAKAHATLESLLRPTLADYGLTVRETPLGYFLLESDRMLLEPAAVRAAEQVFGPLGAQTAFTYLANTIADGDREIPYSTITAIDFAPEAPLGGFKTTDGKPVAPLAADEIALNSWAAEDLKAMVGDTIRVTYFEPESTHGQVRESTVDLKLAAIVAMQGPAADPNLTPTLPGVTDQLSISDWNPPFPFESARVRPRDEEYWNEYKATPKAFVALATGRRLWGSRFGNTTSLRIPPGDGRSVESLSAMLKPDPAAMGLAFQPIRLKAIEASAGTTPFEGLFLGFSFFIIAAALMLVAILFRLGIEQRADQVGVLLALGWPVRRVRTWLLAEGALVALAGAVFGAAVGIGYAWLMLVGLRTLWVAAITTPFVHLFVTPKSLIVGGASGVAVSLVVIFCSVGRLRRQNVRALLTNRVDESLGPAVSRSRWPRRTAMIACALAVAAALAGSGLGEMAQAGAFLASGALALVALMAIAFQLLRTGAGGALVTTGTTPFVWLAFRNAGRHPGRSALTIGLIAAASFLIVAISAFRLDPQAGADSRTTGTGGFSLVADSDQPIYQDLDSEDGQLDLGFSPADRRVLAGAKVFELRVAGGDDASCLNLYQAEQPRVIGIPQSLIDRGGFAWAATAAGSPDDAADPWRLLDKPAVGSDGKSPVPVILDEATAIYALHLKGVGDTYQITDGRGRPLVLSVVALLRNSVLQGALLVSERDFLAHFPDSSGYRFFLIDTPANDAAHVATMLESTLADFGFDAEPADERLAEFFAVQNTYLSTFQSLGGLGLLLGTFGLAAVQLRNVVERRGEIALLRAMGYRRGLVARLVLWENALLLAGGLGIGTFAALVAVFPHLVAGGAHLPWDSIVATLLVVLVVGLAAGMAAVRAAWRAPILTALRGD
jgi:ABC-type lipoprotein release transport system permease subunit